MMQISTSHSKIYDALPLFMLLTGHAIVCCISLTYVIHFYGYLELFAWDRYRVLLAIPLVLPPAALSIAFAYSSFSFGYIAGFYLYTIVLGYLWLIPFSRLQYDHVSAGISAFVSLVAFLVPILLIHRTTGSRQILSIRAFHLLIIIIVALSLVTIAVGMYHNFRVVGLTDIYKFRDELQFPAPLRYAIGITSGALLPFAFACSVEMKARWLAATALLLLLALYPVTLTKAALFAPFWLGFLWVISTLLEARLSVVLSLLAPLTFGVILALLFDSGAISQAHFIDYFGAVNFRMAAFPSISLDVYGDFFSRHELTHFCQISLLKLYTACSYDDQLSVVLSRNYPGGNINASVLATEGIASVGVTFAPITALIAGLIISVGNYTSSRMPARFVLLSSGMLAQSLLNVPLTVLMVTNGAAITFLLWYVTPRSLFSHEQRLN